MVKTVRLDADLEARLERASQAVDETQSEFIRQAVSQRCEQVLGPTLAERLRSVIGVIESGGGRASRTGAAYRELLKRKRAR